MDTIVVGNIDKADNEYDNEWFSTFSVMSPD